MPVNNELSLGNLVVTMGYCTEPQIAEGLVGMNGTRCLGETLVNLGHLTQHQLDWALTYQSMERDQTKPSRVRAFVRKQHAGLVADLHDFTKEVHCLTAKINSKG